MSEGKRNDLWLTDDDVETEIARLQGSEYVRLAQAEHRQKYRRRQYLYNLRSLEKRGRELAKTGWTPDNYADLEESGDGAE